jgi:hypothetical protein
MPHNVPAVYDVFLRPIRKNAKPFYGRKKMCRRKNAQRAQARLRFFVARAAVRRRSIYRPVRRSKGVHHFVYYILFHFFNNFSAFFFTELRVFLVCSSTNIFTSLFTLSIYLLNASIIFP